MYYNEYLKISLHNHFGGNAANRTRNSNLTYYFDLNSAKQRIDDASKNEFEILVFSNHNIFKKNDFETSKAYAETKKDANGNNILLLPGVEIDLINDKNLQPADQKFLHVVLVFNSTADLQMIEDKIDEIIQKNSNNFFTVDNLVEVLMIDKCIMIPHGGRKQNLRCAAKNMQQFAVISDAYYMIPIFIEDTKKIHKARLLEKIKDELGEDKYEYFSNVASVSAADQSPFSDIVEPTYLWGEKSFDALYFAAIMGCNRVLKENDINIKSSYIKTIKIVNHGGSLMNSEIDCSHGLNSIIGNSGSGKTLLLNLISKKLQGKNLEYAVSATNCDYDELYKNSDVQLFDQNDMEIKLNSINVFEGENLYKQIVSTLSSSKTDMLKLLNASPNLSEFNQLMYNFNDEISHYIKHQKNISNLSKIIDDNLKIIKASSEYLSINKSSGLYVDFQKDLKYETNLSKIKEELKSIDSDAQEFNNAFTIIDSLLTKYSVTRREEFEKIKKELDLKIKISSINKKLEYEKNNYGKILEDTLYSKVSNYNSKIGSKFKSIQESKQNLNEAINNVIQALLQQIKIENQIIIPKLDREALKASIKVKDDSFVRLEKKQVSFLISYDNISVFFDPIIGRDKVKINQSEFKNLFIKKDQYDLFYERDVKELLDYISTKTDKLFNSYITGDFSQFISYTINIKAENEYKDIMSMSAGELSKVYIDKMIDQKLAICKNNAIILYDQPDNNLEKKFILKNLCTKLSELKNNYQIFITTHEPLIVVNSDSNRIIHVINNKLVGNEAKISFENLSFVNTTSKKNALEEIASIIDGSTDAVKLRNQIYGGMKNE